MRDCAARVKPLVPSLTCCPTENRPVVALWPGSCLHGIQILKQPRWEDFDYTLDGQRNRFSWAGNGAHPAELDPEGDRAFYLNEIDYPPVPQ